MVSGTSALLLHGLGENPDSYQDLATTLAERQWQVSVPRLIEPHEVSTWALTTCTDRIAASMHGEPAHVIGHSLGAVIALDLAQRHPHLVTSLFLCAPQARVPQALLVLQKLVMQLLPEDRVTVPGTSKQALVTVMGALTHLDLRDGLEGIDRPTTVACGLRDLVNIRAARAIQARIPGAAPQL